MGDISQGNNRAEEKSHRGKCGKHYEKWELLQTIFLEKDHPGRDIGEGSKPTKPKEKEEKEEEDRVLTQLKKTQAHVSV